MRWECDRPDRTWLDYVEHMRALVAAHGRAVPGVELYGPRIRALQVVHADDRGRWPREAGYRGVRGGQPVLGVRAVPPASAA